MTSFSTRLYPRPLPFPSYVFPSNPFRKRPSSSSSPNNSKPTTITSTSTSASSINDTPYLNGHTSYLRCARCSTDLCLTSQIISKGFTGRHGRAYLVCPSNHNGNGAIRSQPSSLPNTLIHKAVPRQLVTGAHTVSDISCSICGAVLGWKYVAAEDEAQRYKVGKFILETRKVRVGRYWEEQRGGEDGGGEAGKGGEGGGGGMEGSHDVEFDSQDEEECDDLFAGVWSPGLALKRRRGKRFVRGGGGEAGS